MMGTIFTKENILEFTANDLLVFAFFFIPFINVFPVALGVIVFSSIVSIAISLFLRPNVKNFGLNTLSLLVLIFMIFTILFSLPVLEEIKSYVRLEFQLRLPMILLPIAFLFRGMASFHVKKAMAAYACGALATSIVMLIVFIFSLISSFDNISYTFDNILLCFQCVVTMVIHRTYSCFNLITALLIFYFLFHDSWNKKRIAFFSTITVFTVIFVFMSGARISAVSLLWILFVIALREIRRLFNGWLFYVLSIAVGILLLVIILSCNERVNNLIVSLVDGSTSWIELDPRFKIWRCGWLLFSEIPHPWIGMGSGSTNTLLQEIYIREQFTEGIDSHWNMHNQFLEILVENGVLGLLLFLTIIFAPILIKSKLRMFYLIWIPALIVNLFFESMLSRSLGTYSITSILLLAGFINEKEIIPTHPSIRRLFLVLSSIAVFSFSLKYILVDKTKAFSIFQPNFSKVEILPGNVPVDLKDASGWRIDSRTASSTWSEWATMYHIFEKHVLEKDDRYHFSLYVYVSEDFDAERLFISVEERQRVVTEVSYNMDQKGMWQLLDIDANGLHGNTAFLLSCYKCKATDFSKVKGFAIFANPKIKITQSE